MVDQTKYCVEAICALFSTSEFGANCVSALDLCTKFVDGEVLCSIVVELSYKQGTPVDECASSFYSVNSHMLAKQNIKYFLTNCETVFGLEKQNLFEPDDLIGLKNPGRVVNTVYRLLVKFDKGKEVPLAGNKGGNELQSVIQEICNHEKTLVTKLLQLLFYRKELLGVLSEWSEDLVAFVFKFTEPLFLVHKELHAKLNSLANEGCSQFCENLHSVFQEILPRLEIYCLYFVHLPAAKDRLTSEFQASPELRDQLVVLSKVISDSIEFHLLFDSPIRQLTNYPLLIGRLAKIAAKSESKATTKSIEKALSGVHELLQKTNAFQREVNQTKATVNLLKRFEGLPKDLPVNPDTLGLHLIDAPFRITYPSAIDGRKSCDLGHCLLTTKYVIIAAKTAKHQPEKYCFHQLITSAMQTRHCDAASLEITFEAERRVKLEKQSKHDVDLNKWVKLLQEAKAACFPDGWSDNGHQFELTTFPTGTDCTVCGDCFSGSVVQGYTCGWCHAKAHAVCLKKQSKLCGVPIRYSSYFHSGIDRNRAVALLINKQPGAFLLRDKSDNPGQKVMSVRVAKQASPVVHIEIFEEKGKFFFGPNLSRQFESLNKMISHYKSANLSESFSTLDCKLTEGVPSPKS